MYGLGSRVLSDSPLLVGAWSPDDHDHTKDDGKQDMPETVMKPHLPPVLRRREGGEEGGIE